MDKEQLSQINKRLSKHVQENQKLKTLEEIYQQGHLTYEAFLKIALIQSLEGELNEESYKYIKVWK